MNIHEEAERERAYHEEANRLMESGGCWIAQDNVMGECQGITLQNGSHDCKSCPAYNCFYQVTNSYASEEGITWAEAIWLAKQFFDIPSSYMCNGEDGEWMKEHDPKKYEDCLRRQAELMGDAPEEKSQEFVKAESSGQMSIMDWLTENS